MLVDGLLKVTGQAERALEVSACADGDDGEVGPFAGVAVDRRCKAWTVSLRVPSPPTTASTSMPSSKEARAIVRGVAGALVRAISNESSARCMRIDQLGETPGGSAAPRVG